MAADREANRFPDNVYLAARHRHWVEAIGRAGIWNPAGFCSVTLMVRPPSKTCGGKFRRKTTTAGGRVVHDDRIFIYRNSPEMTVAEVDNLLVHEMIHQYIFQSGLTDSSAHGRLFRAFMARINAAFAGQLNVTVTGRRAAVSGPGTKFYVILALQSGDNVYCCVISRTRIEWFRRFIQRNHRAMNVDKVGWCKSNDRHFENFRQCRTSLHGEKIPFADFDAYCRKYHLTVL